MTARSVMIVEDEMIVQMHLERIVNQCGHRVTGTASSRDDALEAARHAAPELVLMDINLSGGDDGVEAAQLLSERYGCATVFVTAYADAETLARSESVGAAGFIVKPFIDAEVRAAMSTAFASHARMLQIHERERSLSSALGSMAEGIIVTDEAGCISVMNPQAASLTGWDASKAEGRRLFDVLSCVVSSDRRELGAAIERAQSASLHQLDILCRDGSERALDVELEPLVAGDLPGHGLVVQLRSRSPRRAPPVPTPLAARRPFGDGTRLLVYSHDTFGVGHLQRSLNLIRTLVADHPGLSVLLVTGSPVAHRYKLPPGADYLKLPSVRKVGSENYEPRSLELSASGIQTLRENLILCTIRDYDPNVMLVDHSPVGMKGELLPALEWLQHRDRCTRILGLRDIIDEPSSVIEHWRDERIYEVLGEHYDHVVVYGSREIYDPVSRYAFPADVEAKTRFLGYVCEPGEPGEPAHAAEARAKPGVLVSVGGGDGGELLIATFLEMLQRLRSSVRFHTHILTGPLLERGLQARFREQARDLPVTLEEFVSSTSELVRDADLVVSTAGYNTTTQLLARARRAILVPRVLHRQEQLIRARRLDELGLVTCLHPDSITPARLLEAIDRALDDDSEPLRDRAPGLLPLDGARGLSQFCATLRA